MHARPYGLHRRTLSLGPPPAASASAGTAPSGCATRSPPLGSSGSPSIGTHSSASPDDATMLTRASPPRDTMTAPRPQLPALTLPCSPSPAMPRQSRSSPMRRALLIMTVVVAIAVGAAAALLATIVALYDVRTVDLLPLDVSARPGAVERVPRIIHQTWKTAELPERWRNVSESCRALHPTFEYRLWTDADGRELVRDHYPSFLATYDAYPYAIERADAMRYFILRKFGGIYLDLDVGCRRPLDALLEYGAVLPYTKPVGLSNDVMISAKEHPFMRFITEHLAEQAGWYGTKYPTVMFATGPMLVSRLYNRYIAELGPGLTSDNAVRIIPRPLYGKSQYSADDSHDPFFRHYFASSWHGNDAGAIAAIAVVWRWALIGLGAVAALGLIRLLVARFDPRRDAEYSSLPTSMPPTPEMQQVPFATPVRSPSSASDVSLDDVPPASKPAFVSLDFDQLPNLVAHASVSSLPLKV